MKTKITKEKWLKIVAKEVRALNKSATSLELSKLNFITFDSESRRNCIYGQMTGECSSSRAIELIHSCCAKFTNSDAICDTPEGEELSFRQTKKGINGKVDRSRGIYSISFFSSIEHYIMLKDSKPQNIIAYLKGETKKLVL